MFLSYYFHSQTKIFLYLPYQRQLLGVKKLLWQACQAIRTKYNKLRTNIFSPIHLNFRKFQMKVSKLSAKTFETFSPVLLISKFVRQLSKNKSGITPIFYSKTLLNTTFSINFCIESLCWYQYLHNFQYSKMPNFRQN